MKKYLVVFSILAVLLLGACDMPTSDVQKTINLSKNLEVKQPTPTDVEYSLERYNLIRRAYWVNGMREKAINLPAPLVLPLGYIVLTNETSVLAQFTVEGKVSSLNSYLTPMSEYYSSELRNDWVSDADGSYGENDDGIFFFTSDGKYVEWNGTYLYSDLPIFIQDPVIKTEVVR